MVKDNVLPDMFDLLVALVRRSNLFAHVFDGSIEISALSVSAIRLLVDAVDRIDDCIECVFKIPIVLFALSVRNELDCRVGKVDLAIFDMSLRR